MEEVVGGLDIGTSSIKFALYGRGGCVLSLKRKHSSILSGGAELPPQSLIRDISAIVREAASSKPGFRIKAIGLSALFPSLVVLDKSGRPLTNILTWLDPSGMESADVYRAGGIEPELLHKETGCVVHGAHTVWKIVGIRESAPAVYRSASKFLSLSDYVVYRLTGKCLTSKPIAATTGLLDLNAKDWNPRALSISGIRKEQLPQLRSVSHSEPILRAFRSRAGLDPDCLLVLGAGDGHLCNIGSGCSDAGLICSTMGTTSALRVTSPVPAMSGPKVWSHYFSEGIYISGISTNSGFGALEWLYRDIYRAKPEVMLKEIAALGAAGAPLPVVLPFLYGERGPGYNHRALANLCGLSYKTTRSEILQSMVEGVFFNLYQCYKTMTENFGIPRAVVATGGYSLSARMLQIQADIFNVKVKAAMVAENSAAGAAYVAADVLGKARFRVLVPRAYGKTYCPDRHLHLKYLERYKEYTRLYSFFSGRD